MLTLLPNSHQFPLPQTSQSASTRLPGHTFQKSLEVCESLNSGAWIWLILEGDLHIIKKK